jgi:hypothetical protein
MGYKKYMRQHKNKQTTRFVLTNHELISHADGQPEGWICHQGTVQIVPVAC